MFELQVKRILKRLCCWLALLPIAGAAYTVTNDLAANICFTCWTNDSGANLTLINSNISPGSSAILSVDTNGNGGISVKVTNALLSVMVPWSDAKFGGTTASELISTVMQFNAPRVYVPQDSLVLKSYFQTGSRLSAVNYWEFIDSFFWRINAQASNTQPWTVRSGNSLPLIADVYPRAATNYLTASITNTSSGRIAARVVGGFPPYKYEWSIDQVTNYKVAIFPSQTFLAGTNFETTTLEAKLAPTSLGAFIIYVINCKITDASNSVERVVMTVNFLTH